MSSLRRTLNAWRLKREPAFAPVSVQQMLSFVTRHVDYYRPYADASGLREFPILTKDIIRSRADELASDDLCDRKWHYETSGGSTGEPVRFIRDEEFVSRIRAATLESKSWAGYQPGDRLLKFWGNRQTQPPRGVRSTLRDWLSNTVLLDTFLLDEQRIDDYIDRVRRFRPKLIVGFSTSLYEIAKRMRERGIRIRGVGAVTSTAGTLYDEMRECISEAFQCKVFNRYGSSEVSVIATEDGRDLGLRVASTVFVEILRPDNSPCEEGELGDIVVTSLANFAMPIIRFRIGDRGSLRMVGELPYLEKVQGRTIELFRSRDGKLIDGQLFIQAMYFRDWVTKFRLRQLDYERVRVEVETNEEADPSDLRDVEKKIKAALGGDTLVEWDFVDRIQPLASGKHLYTTCEIP